MVYADLFAYATHLGYFPPPVAVIDAIVCLVFNRATLHLCGCPLGQHNAHPLSIAHTVKKHPPNVRHTDPRSAQPTDCRCR
jgi:hypothetical protein